MPWKRWCAVIALVSAGLQAAIAATGGAARPSPATDSQALPAPRNRGFGILYAPSAADNPTFREEVSFYAYRPCDYFDARAATPTLEQMLQYEAVLTWVNQAYADNETFGDRLADYVDAGGRAILGQWTYPTTQSYCLAGRIMVPGYCPVIATAYESGSFATSGWCTIAGEVYSDYRDLLDLLPGAVHCYWDDCEIAVAMRRDAGVFYCSGHTGGAAGSGAWAALTSYLAIMIFDFFPATCCDPATGVCSEEWGSNCLWPLEWGEAEYCYELDPPCGEPGACCDDYTASCADGVLALDCLGRHAPGESCAALDPPCGSAGPGDLDVDGDCDLHDYALLAECLAGPGQPNPGCYPAVFDRADIDGDGDVDLADVGQFQIAYTGSTPS